MNETVTHAQQPGGAGEAAITATTDDTRMAAPSCSDVARGGPTAAWAPSELHHADEQPRPEAAGEFGVDKVAAALGVPTDTVAGARAWMSGELQFSDEQLAQFDRDHEAAAITELRALWGDKFLSNFKAIEAYLDTLPDNAGVFFKHARDGSGKAIANDPATLQLLLGHAQGRQSVALSGSVGQQIAAIESAMRTDRNAYNRDETLQARYRELLRMRERAR
jgi:hypothetical protein